MDVTLRGNNLYRNGSIIQFEDGEQLLIREPLQIAGTIRDNYHTVLRTDRLDILAYKFYSSFVEDSSKYWWVIADANNITNPLDLSLLIGKEILIPNILTILLELQ